MDGHSGFQPVSVARTFNDLGFRVNGIRIRPQVDPANAPERKDRNRRRNEFHGSTLLPTR
jgi:hypothetical protein